jgi:hypothetical protein
MVRSTLALAVVLSVASLSRAKVGAFVSGTSSDNTTSPGRTTVAVSSNNLTIASGGVETLMLTGQLARGAGKRVLAVNATVGDLGGFGSQRSYTCHVTANGIDLQAPGGNLMVQSNGPDDSTGSVSASFWLDMDDPANAALLGVPINLNLSCTELTGNGDFGLEGTLVATFLKK